MERTRYNSHQRNVIAALFVTEHLNETENSHMVRNSRETENGDWKRKAQYYANAPSSDDFASKHNPLFIPV